MKYLLLIFSTICVLSSCEKEIDKNLTPFDQAMASQLLDNVVSSGTELLNYSISNNQKSSDKSVSENLINDSRIFFNQMGISDQEIIEMFIDSTVDQSDINQLYGVLGLAVTAVSENANNKYSLAKGDFLGCLGQAVGYDAIATLGAAAYHLVAGEAAADFATDAAAKAAFRKAARKAATKVLSSVVSGLGLVVAAVEVAICMSS